jgi:hypothetical protein
VGELIPVWDSRNGGQRKMKNGTFQCRKTGHRREINGYVKKRWPFSGPLLTGREKNNFSFRDKVEGCRLRNT